MIQSLLLSPTNKPTNEYLHSAPVVAREPRVSSGCGGPDPEGSGWEMVDNDHWLIMDGDIVMVGYHW